MKRYFSLIFVFIFFLITTTSKEVFKFPLLVKHYLEHKKYNSDLNCVDFFRNHYFNGNPKDSDYEKDMKLPFKNVSSIYSFVIINFQSNIKIPTDVYFYIKKIEILHNNSFFYSQYRNSIWRPPLIK